MDRQGYKKIKNYIFAWIFAVIIITICVVIFYNDESKIRNEQLDEIIILHPELENEMLQSYKHYGQMIVKYIRYLWVFAIITLCITMISLYYIERKRSMDENQDNLNRLDELSEQLERFRRGEYHVLLKYIPSDLGEEMPEQWFRINELLRELGHYFNDLRIQLAEEENGTKALITDISHQLKTPLSSLRTSHELIHSKRLTDKERAEFFEKEEYEIHKLEILLNEMVNLSRLEAGMIRITPEHGSIKQTITNSVNQIFMKAHIRNIDIEVDMKDDIMLMHDKKWTVEALSNVLDNAIKYSEDDTHIYIRVSMLTTNLLIEIEDEGMGISEKEIHNIFKRFYRGEEASQHVDEGVGVGLYLARRILEEQGGTIIAKRRMQKGTIFKITLPL